MAFYDRAAWGARPPRTTPRFRGLDQIHFFDVHHETGDEHNETDVQDGFAWMRSVQNFHMDTRGWNDVGYHFVVDRFGNVYEGRGWLATGAHDPNHNTDGVGVSFMGDGDALDPEDAARAFEAIRQLADETDTRTGRSNTRMCHRDDYATHCPGDQIAEWVHAGMPVDSQPAPAPEQPADPQPAPAPQDPSQDPLPPFPGYMKVGSRGWGVAGAQDKFLHRGWRITVDGIFGTDTDRVVRAFQTEKGLAVDGIIGPRTWACMWNCPV